MLRAMIALILTLSFLSTASAQSADAPDRSATGGAQTLEDIMARQRGEAVDNSFRSDATGDASQAADISNQLGTLAGILTQNSGAPCALAQLTSLPPTLAPQRQS